MPVNSKQLIQFDNTNGRLLIEKVVMNYSFIDKSFQLLSFGYKVNIRHVYLRSLHILEVKIYALLFIFMAK